MRVRREAPASFFTLPQVPLPFTVWNATKCGSGEPQPQTVTMVLDVVEDVVVTDEDELDEELLDVELLELLDVEVLELLDVELLDVEVLELLDVDVLELLVVELLDVEVLELLEVLVEVVVVFVEVVVVVGFGGLQVEGSAVQPPAGQSFARYLVASSFLLPVGQTRQ